MNISIAERLKPLSHLPGIMTLLPGGGSLVQIFPCLIRLYRLEGRSPSLLSEISLDLKGPVEQFTVCNDLEKGRLTVSGKTQEGWIRYHLISFKNGNGIRLISEKTPIRGFILHTSHNTHTLHEKEWLDLMGEGKPFEPYQIPFCDRLSLGSHKKQDWEMIKRRLDLVEIFPLLHRLGQLIPGPTREAANMNGGIAALLEDCRECAGGNKPEKGALVWKRFFLAAFQSMLVPQGQDTHYQGLISGIGEPLPGFSPLIILSESAHLIREIFFRQKERRLHILPFLFPEFHAGRLIDIPLAGEGSLSLEWTKKRIRRLIFNPGCDEELFFHFPRDVHTYRVRQDKASGKGERRSSGTGMVVQKNIRYYFDNFQ